MSSKRLYEVAREHNLSSDALMALVARLGFEVRSHMSVASPEILEAIDEEFRQQRESLKAEIARREKKTRERKARVRQAAEQEAQVARDAQEAADKLRKEEEERKAKVAAEVAAREKEKEAAAAPPPPPPPPPQPPPVTKPFAPGARPAPPPRIRPAASTIAGRPAGATMSSRTAARPQMQTPGLAGAPPRRRRRRGPKKRRQRVDQRDVAASFRKTIAELGTRSKSRRRQRREGGIDTLPEPTRTIEINEFMSLAELAHKMEVTPTQVVAKCLELGMLATVNQRLDLDTIETIALEFDYSIKLVEEIGEETLAEEPDSEESLKPRHPVVTIMGHVDHGKTSLLDHIRESNVIAGEKGGITQHIGAYAVEFRTGRITFLDTPGHAAFTAMRARGAQATDIVILVVAVDDSVMPQTVEAIDHAKAAGVPIIVAINKMDLPGADLERVKSQLAEHGLTPEEWSGDTIMIPVSAKTGEGVEKLLEMVHLQADVLELKANPDRRARGVIIEAQLDRGRGPLATVLIQNGTLMVGDYFVTGSYSGRVRTMVNERGHTVEAAEPASPVLVTGADGVPQAGDTFIVCEDDQQSRTISQMRERLRREQAHHRIQKTSLANIYDRIQEGAVQELKIVIKGDVDGSVEVLADTLAKIKSEEVQVNVIHRGVGAINETDVLLAAASEAVVVGFHVRPDTRAREVAAREGVDVRLYDIIYEVETDIRKALEGMLAPIQIEERSGEAKVKETFRISKIGTIAGCEVTEGVVRAKNRLRVIRDGVTVYTGVLHTVRRFTDAVSEVEAGLECGLKIEDFNDVKVGDVFEFFRIVEKQRKLE
ncbi:MAG TPA: translation initiation factor IF-2 [Acidobacteriota bacterium]|nr:translation initiation factor IF-2 [Acidobacteriota bacterium]